MAARQGMMCGWLRGRAASRAVASVVNWEWEASGISLTAMLKGLLLRW